MAGLGPIVAVLWKELGLAPPVGQIGSSFDFELGEMAISLALQDNGETVILRGCIGYLDGNAHEAGDQLSRVMRLGLALTALNGAVLDASEAADILEPGHEGQVPVHAMAMASLGTPSSILPALYAVLDWQTATETILTRSSDPSGADMPGSRNPGPELDDSMIIFQP